MGHRFVHTRRWMAGIVSGWLALVLLSPSAMAAKKPNSPLADATYGAATAQGASLQAGAVQIGGESPFAPDAVLLELVFVQQGRADAIYVQLKGHTMLVDGGDLSKRDKLQAFLSQQEGGMHVNTLLGTHAHSDHIGGLLSFIKEGGTTKEFYSGYATNTWDKYMQDKVFPLLKKKGIPYKQVKDGDRFFFGAGGPEDGLVPLGEDDIMPEGCAFIQAYRWGDPEAKVDANARSVVLHITYGERTVLLMADAAGLAQRHYLTFDHQLFKADVLKAAHHGVTPTVEPFLEVVDPSLILVTHTRKGATTQLNQAEMKGLYSLYSGEGTIHMQTDGKVWYVWQELIP